MLFSCQCCHLSEKQYLQREKCFFIADTKDFSQMGLFLYLKQYFREGYIMSTSNYWFPLSFYHRCSCNKIRTNIKRDHIIISLNYNLQNLFHLNKFSCSKVMRMYTLSWARLWVRSEHKSLLAKHKWEFKDFLTLNMYTALNVS